MPRVYRSMREQSGMPAVGRNRRALGVVLPAEGVTGKPDIRPDSEGKVRPGTGGMSVAPEWWKQPLHRIPRRLTERYQEITGTERTPEGDNGLVMWAMGTGPFVSGHLATGLQLRVDAESHGNVEPDKAMTVSEYEAALTATRSSWTKAEQ